MGPTAGARRAPMQGPEGSLCRAGLGLGPKGPNPSRVAKSGPVGFGPEGRHVAAIPRAGLGNARREGESKNPYLGKSLSLLSSQWN